MAAIQRVVVMGPSGCGKSTVGRALAARFGAEFCDADSLHSPLSIEKMRQGRGLEEADRLPWLQRVHARIAEPGPPVVEAARSEQERTEPRLVVACSALRGSYREILRASLPDVAFFYLRVDASELRRRLANREGHFAGPGLVDSQLATLELQGFEREPLSWMIEGQQSVEDVLSDIQAAITGILPSSRHGDQQVRSKARGESA